MRPYRPKRYNLQVIGPVQRGLLRIDNRDDGSTYEIENGTLNVRRLSARGKAPRHVRTDSALYFQLIEMATKEFASK